MFAKSVAVSTIANLASPISVLLASSLVAQSFGPSGRGEVAAVNAIVVLAVAAASLGAPEALTYFVARNGRASRSPFLSPLLVTCFGGVLATATTWLLAPLLSGNDSVLTTVIRLCSLAILPSMIVAVVRGAAAGRHEWNRIAAEKILGASVRIVGLIVPFLLGALSVPIAAVVLVSAPAIGGLFYLRPSRRQLAHHGVTAREFVAYSTTSWAGTVAGMLAARLSQAIMLPLSDSYQLGLFAVAVNLAELMLISNQAFRDVAFAVDSSSNDVQMLARASRISGLVALITAVGIAITSPLVVPALFGTEFTEAIPLTIALSLGLVVGIPGSVAGMGLGARGRPGLRSYSLIAGLLVNVALIFILVPVLGAWGAVTAAVVTSAVTSNLNLVHLRRAFGLGPGQFIFPSRDDFATLSRQAQRLLRRR